MAKPTIFERLCAAAWDEIEAQADLPEKSKRKWAITKKTAGDVVERNEVRRVVAGVLLELRKVEAPKAFKAKIDSIIDEIRRG